MKKIILTILSLVLLAAFSNAQDVTYVNVDACHGSTYKIRGKEIQATGVYYDTLLSATGQDSVVCYVFNMLPTSNTYDTAHICKGSTYQYHDSMYATTGDYHIMYKSLYGCDSAFHLHLVVHDNYTHRVDTTVCKNGLFEVNGERIVQTGVYTETFKSKWGCDSTVEWHVTVNDTVHSTVMIDACKGTTVNINGKLVPATGTYYDTLRTTKGCDSIVMYVFNVLEVYDRFDTVRICKGDYHSFHGEMLSQAGDYTHTAKSVYGCDSVEHLHLEVADTFYRIIDTIACGQSFNFHGRIIYESGVYFDSLRSSLGCDSVYELRLLLNRTTVSEVNMDACQGDSVLVNGKIVPATGIYVDTLLTRHGCDSVVRYIFNVHNRFEQYDTMTTCADQPYIYHGQTYTASGDFTIYLKTANYCDSIYHLHLTVHPYYITEYDTLVCGTEYWFHNQHLTESGTYDHRTSTINGCDSIERVHLILEKPKETYVNMDICNGDSAYINGRMVPATGTYTDTLISRHGCDSVIHYTFVVHNRFEQYDTMTTCADQPYIYHGQTYTASGDFTLFFKTASYCDSIYHLHLTVNEYYLTERDTTVCGTEYWFHNQHLTESGTYDFRTSTIHGCDSIERINLTLDKPKETFVNMDICYGDSAYINGHVVPGNGTYTDTMHTRLGCDSVIHYIFNVHNQYEIFDTAVTCANQPYVYHGETYTGSGDYSVYFKTVRGCDSVYHLNLTVLPYFIKVTDTIICGTEYQFHNMTLTESGTYDYRISTPDGCDSIHRINLLLDKPVVTDVVRNVCSGDSACIGGVWIPATGIYEEHLLTSHGCDSTVRYIFNVHSSFEVFDTAHICRGESYLFHDSLLTGNGDHTILFHSVYGCDSAFHLHLVVHDTYYNRQDVTICENDSFKVNGVQITQSGVYREEFKSKSGCDSICEYYVTVLDTVHTESMLHVCKGSSVIIGGKDVTGMGVYFDTLKTTHGCDSIVKYTIIEHSPFHIYDTAQICQGVEYHYHDSVYTTGGDYNQTFLTTHGCDSVYHLHLEVSPNFMHRIDTTICENEFLEINGTQILTSGVYTQVFKSQHECDSIIEWHITVNDTANSEQTLHICHGASVIIGGKPVTDSGTYLDTLRTEHGCDSIVRYTVISHMPFAVYDTAHICRGDEYLYHDSVCTVEGDYVCRFITASGCDSTYYLHLFVHDNFMQRTDTTICSDEYLEINGIQVLQTGVYTQEYKSKYGCDSIYEWHVTVNDTAYRETTLHVCHGSSVIIAGKTVTTSGTYFDTLRTIHGCDSVVRYTVVMHSPYSVYDTAHICRGDAYLYHDTTYTLAGDYVHNFETASGCDSTYYLHLIVHDNYTQRKDTTICRNDYLEIDGTQILQSGVYTQVFKTKYGCDSTYEWHVIVNDTAYRETTLHICQGSSVIISGREVTNAGTYFDTLHTTHGCDSIIRYTVVLHAPYAVFDTAHICQGDSYLYHDTLYTLAGDYIHTFHTASGCDSTYHLHLFVHDNYSQRKDTTICSNDYLEIDGIQILQSGTYIQHIKTKYGCDSTFEWHVIVNDTAYRETTLHVCQGSSVIISGREVTEAGTYFDTLHTTHGCDSIIRYTVVLHAPYNIYDTAHICNGDVYDYHGIQCTIQGDYNIVGTTLSGCDSTYHLHLYVHDEFWHRTDTTICSNEFLEIDGTQILQSGVYTQVFKTKYGCDSTYEWHVTVNDTAYRETTLHVCQGGSVIISGRVVTEAGTYFDTLHTTHGCDSIIRYTVVLHAPYSVYDTAHICRGDVYNYHGTQCTSQGDYNITNTTLGGCDSTYHLHLYVHDQFMHRRDTTICSDQFLEIDGVQVLQSGIYPQTFKTKYGCDSIYEWHVVVYDTAHTYVTIESCQGSTVILNGKEIPATGTYTENMRTSLGCDSIITYVFNEHAPFERFDTAHVCMGETYQYHGNTYQTSGNHTVYFKSVHGCDSNFHLFLTVHDTLHFDTTIVNCSGRPFIWNGQRITKAGKYIARFSTAEHGCDSIWELNFVDTVPPVYFDTTICIGDYVDYRGHRYNRAVQDTIIAFSQDSLECDTTHYINVKIDTLTYQELRVVECGKSNYLFNGHLYSESGVYVDTGLTVHGCELITRLDLRLVSDTAFYETIDLCNGDSAIINDSVFKQTGRYDYTIRTSEGCDINYHYLINVYPSVSVITETQHVCGPMDSARCAFDGKYYRPGKYTLKRPSTNNPCDIKCQLNVIQDSYMHDTTIFICSDALPYVYPYSGKTHFEAGVYLDTLKTQGLQCDSIYRLDLRVDSTHRRHEFYDTVYNCSGTPYLWHGLSLTRDSDYTVVLQDRYHCDSILHLNYRTRSTTKFMYFTLCTGLNQSVTVHGHTYSTPGTYTDSLFNSAGCPDYFKIVINFDTAKTINDTLYVCDPNELASYAGQQYAVGDHYFKAPGDTSQCPDMIHLIVIDESAQLRRTVTICETSFPYNDPYSHQQYWSAGTYNTTIMTSHGCLKPYHLVIYADSSNHLYNKYDTICRGDVYTYRGVKFTDDKDTNFVIPRGLLCDSIVRLRLTVLDQRDTSRVTICQGDSYHWVATGQTYTVAGTYTHQGGTYNGCTHYDVLELVVVTPISVSGVVVNPVCACDTGTPIIATLRGLSRNPDTYTINFDAKGHAQGFGDIVNKAYDPRHPDIQIAWPKSVSQDSLRYVRPDFYDITIHFDDGACDKQGNDITTKVEVRYPSWVLEQNWNDVVAVIRENHHDENGKSYTFSAYEWYVDGYVIPGAVGSYLYTEGVVLTGSVVQAALTRTGETTPVMTCGLEIVSIPDVRSTPIRDPKVVTYPIRQNPHTTLNSPEAGHYYLYSLSGQLISSGECQADTDIDIALPSVQGYYMLRVVTSNINKAYKILVH